MLYCDGYLFLSALMPNRELKHLAGGEAVQDGLKIVN